jgi:hypothetical protein
MPLNIINENDDSFYKTSKFDLILIILILLLSIFSILWVSADQIRQPLQPKSAIIYQDNMKLEEINMSKDGVIEKCRLRLIKERSELDIQIVRNIHAKKWIGYKINGRQ